MANFWERVQNLFDDHQDRERQRVREGHERALYETRDALLVSALAIKNEWENQLARDGGRLRSATDAKYAAQLEGLNVAFAALRQMEPRITTQLHIDQFRDAAISGAERVRQTEFRINQQLEQRNDEAPRLAPRIRL
jgi:hypothetical protein